MTESADYDVIIIGASFAGLAVAMQLWGRRVLLIDQYPVGEHQMSACCTPRTTAYAVGAQASILGTHNSLVLHAAGKAIRFPLRDPYITFDYHHFCQTMLRQTDAEVRRMRCTGLDARKVRTDRGTVTASFIVNASGWHTSQQKATLNGHDSRHLGYGMETELPIRWQDAGLHFYFIKEWVNNGYAWIFPCQETTRFGVGSFAKSSSLRTALDKLLAHHGLAVGRTHGGVLAISRRQPLQKGVFLVGDAAGQCLPVTGEGIRTAIFHGLHCGRAIARALDGAISPLRARQLYSLQVRSMDRFHRRLLLLQTLVARTPEPILAGAAHLCAYPATTHWIMNKYWTRSGWFTAQTS